MSNVTVNPGWATRYEEIKSRTHISLDQAILLVNQMVADGLLTTEERTRVGWKVKLLEPFVTRLVLNMIKGTVKYPTDDWPTNTWMDMGMDDKADAVNYELLKDNHVAKLLQELSE